MSTWENDDGLYVKFGTTEATVQPGGEYGTVAEGLHVVEFDLDCTDVATTDAALSDSFKLPQNAIIRKAELTVLVAPDGGTSLDFGLLQSDKTDFDYDGIIDGVTEAGLDDTEGATYTFEPDVAPDSGAVGALVGDLNGVSEPCYFSWRGVGTFTAGRLLYRVYYSMRPQTIA